MKKIFAFILGLLIACPVFAKDGPGYDVPPSTQYCYAGGLSTMVDGVLAGGFTKVIPSTPTITAGAYTTGQVVGGLITLASAARVSGGTGIINSVILCDKSKQNVSVDIFFFDSNPSASTFTDNATFTINAADLTKCVGVINITASNYSSASANSVATAMNQGLSFGAIGSSSIYAVIVARGSATYATTSALTLKVKIFQD